MTSSNRNIFRVTGTLCGEFTGEFPTQRPVTRSFDIFFDLCLNKRMSKQSRRWWFETPLRALWRYWNANMHADMFMCIQFHFTNELFLFSCVSVLCYDERHMIGVNWCGCSRALYDKLGFYFQRRQNLHFIIQLPKLMAQNFGMSYLWKSRKVMMWSVLKKLLRATL